MPDLPAGAALRSPRRREPAVHRFDQAPVLAANARASGSSQCPRPARASVELTSVRCSGTISSSTPVGWSPARGATSTRWEPSDGVVALGHRAVPDRIEHLSPLVGSHHHDVVAGGDVGQQLEIGDADAQPWPVLGDRLQHLEPVGGRRRRPVLLAQRTSGQHEVEPVEPGVGHRGAGHRQVGDGRGVERPGVDADHRGAMLEPSVRWRRWCASLGARGVARFARPPADPTTCRRSRTPCCRRARAAGTRRAPCPR